MPLGTEAHANMIPSSLSSSWSVCAILRSSYLPKTAQLHVACMGIENFQIEAMMSEREAGVEKEKRVLREYRSRLNYNRMHMVE